MKLRHYDHDGRARFVTFCTHRKLPLLTSNASRQAVIEAMNVVRNQTGLRLVGYVIMPEHLHLVVIPPMNLKLGPVVGEIKRLSALAILSEYRAGKNSLVERLTVTRNRTSRLSLWQRRCYDRNCRSDKEMWEYVRYCHDNPVKRGLVRNPGDWPWSSFRFYDGKPGVVIDMNVDQDEV